MDITELYAAHRLSLVRLAVLLVDDVASAEDVEARAECGPGQVDDPPVVTPAATETIGIGEQATFDEGYAFTARIDAEADPSLVVEGDDGRTLNYGLEVGDPRISTVQPTSALSDGASLFVTSASDPSYVAVLGQDGDQLRRMDAVGEIDLLNEGGVRTWLTQNGGVVTAVEAEDGTWQTWVWVGVSLSEMAALPSGTACFDDIDDPSTVRSC